MPMPREMPSFRTAGREIGHTPRLQSRLPAGLLWRRTDRCAQDRYHMSCRSELRAGSLAGTGGPAATQLPQQFGMIEQPDAPRVDQRHLERANRLRVPCMPTESQASGWQGQGSVGPGDWEGRKRPSSKWPSHGQASEGLASKRRGPCSILQIQPPQPSTTRG
jgi:hypothetical protein